MENDWHCPNPDCPPQVLSRLHLWASPEALDITGCDAAFVKQLVERGLVRDAAEFYRLKVKEIAALEGMTAERAQQFFDAITASMKREAWRTLYGLGIPNLDPAAAQLLCRHVRFIEDLFTMSFERLAALDGVSEMVARSLSCWSGDTVNRRLLRRLQKSGVNFDTTRFAGNSTK